MYKCLFDVIFISVSQVLGKRKKKHFFGQNMKKVIKPIFSNKNVTSVERVLTKIVLTNNAEAVTNWHIRDASTN